MSVEMGKAAYVFGIYFGGRSDRTFARESGRRDETIGEKSRMTSRLPV